MSQKELEQLDEFKASGENSETADPVTPAGGTNHKRPADKNNGDKAPQKVDGANAEDMLSASAKKSPARPADKGMKESVEEMFAGSDLSEEFKDKATTIFEAAVHAKLTEEVARLEEEFNSKLDEQVQVAVSDLVEKVDSYLDYVVEQWMQENKVAIDRGIRAEIAESFIEGLRDLFVEHNINLPEEEVNVIADMSEELEAKEKALNESVNETIELRKEIESMKAKNILEGYSKDLTETQAEKLRTLSEGVEYSDSAEFERKVQIIKEQYFGGKAVLTENTDGIDPIEVESLTENNAHVDPAVAAYAKAISKTLRK